MGYDVVWFYRDMLGNATQAVDSSGTCPWTNCSVGGCEAGYEAINSEICLDLQHCPEHLGFCRKEQCCPLRTSVMCCPLLPCNVTYDEGDDPRQFAAQGAGEGGGKQSHGPLVALIVIGCLLLAGCTTGIVLWCCGLLPDLHNLRIRNLTSYEPIFTGQPYTPNMGSHRRSHAMPPASTDDIPWNRFCAAVMEASRRLLYGRRYIEESASAAAAAERYRTLNSLGRFRGPSTAASGGAAAGDTDNEVERGWPPGKGPATPGSLALSPYLTSRHKAQQQDDDLGVDEVFTLEDLGADNAGMTPVAVAAAWRPSAAVQLPVSRSAVVAATVGSAMKPSQPLRASSLAPAASTTAPPPAGPWMLRSRHMSTTSATGGLSSGAIPAPMAVELSGEPISRTSAAATAAGTGIVNDGTMTTPPGQALLLRLNQFQHGNNDGYGGGNLYGGGGGHDVIHTRPLALGDGGGDDDDAAEVPPEDVDAPLRWLPSPQITGS
ncbi:hypothetical protein VOLCADRAFT_115599 [Volvox carteri f. nagariensis]|uniref:Uncharacterized protein n=1 Tax=Volvox carteri f. nagariensis TaxID=3068 RepID=D8TH43_VOLCA|nr:uncharacterized protein VOLCADRAFT_115599 [Volvox carteri f. nagariensis]EFJ53004.1 hypothetical protein VOLCADRAFT_115599 [Volvox carteri f. nagariensis]|eukprot:XP_002946009.1 hypothetical protein VOLCADRAFT_115599 [Volvox carteri f. nagariensis]